MGEFEDTFVRMPSLVDTREDSQSQPFERPGMIIPRSLPSWLHHAGLWWQPNQEVVTGDGATSDSVSWIKLTITAVLVSWCFAAMAVAFSPPPDFGIFAQLVVFPAVGFAACWAFRQMLPRTSSVSTVAINRIIGAAVVCCIGVIAYIVLLNTGIGGFGGGRDGSFFRALFLVGLLIDWRCFISAYRYPRVGVLKTLTVMVVFILAMIISDANNETLVQTFLLILMAATLSVQILAPHGHAPLKNPASTLRTQPDFRDKNQSGEAPVTETRYDAESFSLKEEV